MLAAGFVMEVQYPEWLANPVLVVKKNKKWRMCIDYTHLNKVCPKDPFALPRIDQVIDSTAGCAYGPFCYTTMPFGLKNAGATNQRCMQKCLHDQIGRNAHAYVDDIVIKTKEKHTLLADLKETFDNLHRFQMKLNPEKCVFGVPAGQLLSFLVSARGIEANLEKIAAIDNMRQIGRAHV